MVWRNWRGRLFKKTRKNAKMDSFWEPCVMSVQVTLVGTWIWPFWMLLFGTKGVGWGGPPTCEYCFHPLSLESDILLVCRLHLFFNGIPHLTLIAKMLVFIVDHLNKYLNFSWISSILSNQNCFFWMQPWQQNCLSCPNLDSRLFLRLFFTLPNLESSMIILEACLIRSI